MKFSQILNSILSAQKGTISSKRVCGLTGWLVCLIVLIVCAINNTQAPEFADYVIITSASLLGIDSVMTPLKRNKE